MSTGTAVAIAVENARRRHLRMPAPAARLRTFKDLLRHIAEFAVANNLQSLDELFPGHGPLWDAYDFSKRDVKHINGLWQRLDERFGNWMSEGWVCIYRNREGGPFGVIRWVDPLGCNPKWSFDVTQSGEVVELTEA